MNTQIMIKTTTSTLGPYKNLRDAYDHATDMENQGRKCTVVIRKNSEL